MPEAIYPVEPAADAFGRLRVSNPQTLFDSKQLHDKGSLWWDESITQGSTATRATSTHSTANAEVSMYVGGNGDIVIRQTKQRFNYQPGKSQMVALTGLLPTGTGVTARVGAFDANNGLFFQVSGSTLSVVKRKATNDTAVAQSAWNLDKLDGSGPSGLAIDLTKTQIFVIDYEWLGVGRVRFGVYVEGRPVYCHEFTHTNDITSVYMATPNLPIRYELRTTSAAATMSHICSTVVSEGGHQAFGTLRAAGTGGTHLDANTADTIYALLGIRLKTTHLDASVKPEALSVIAETGTDFEWMLGVNPTVAASSVFTYADQPNSPVQMAKGVTANTISSSTTFTAIMAGGFVKNSVQSGGTNLTLNSPLSLGSKIDGTRDQFVLAVRPLAANADIQGTLTWREQL